MKNTHSSKWGGSSPFSPHWRRYGFAWIQPPRRVISFHPPSAHSFLFLHYLHRFLVLLCFSISNDFDCLIPPISFRRHYWVFPNCLSFMILIKTHLPNEPFFLINSLLLSFTHCSLEPMSQNFPLPSWVYMIFHCIIILVYCINPMNFLSLLCNFSHRLSFFSLFLSKMKIFSFMQLYHFLSLFSWNPSLKNSVSMFIQVFVNFFSRV